MKHTILYNSLIILLLASLVTITSCDEDVPPAEDEEEIITDVILTFTNGSITLTAKAQDADGDGPESLTVTEDIFLSANTTYELSIGLENSIEGSVITDEVEAESDAHMFFFAFTENIFADPQGDGNIDNRTDAINYEDQDANGQPIGLQTTWTTADAATGTFRVLLKHQPDLKSATSTSADGSSDIDLTLAVVIE